MSPEIQRLVERLRLSPGDVLGLAREAAGDPDLRSVDDLSARQRRTLEAVLQMLAQPITLRDYPSDWIAAA